MARSLENVDELELKSRVEQLAREIDVIIVRISPDVKILAEKKHETNVIIAEFIARGEDRQKKDV